MEYNFVVTVQLPDGSQKQLLSKEPYKIGFSLHGGVVISCNTLTKIME